MDASGRPTNAGPPGARRGRRRRIRRRALSAGLRSVRAPAARAQRGFAARSEGDRGTRAAASRPPSDQLAHWSASTVMLSVPPAALAASIMLETAVSRSAALLHSLKTLGVGPLDHAGDRRLEIGGALHQLEQLGIFDHARQAVRAEQEGVAVLDVVR